MTSPQRNEVVQMVFDKKRMLSGCTKWIGRLLFVILCLVVTVLAFKLNEEKSKKTFSANVPINDELLREKLQKSPPEWMLRQIRKDLGPFSEKGITPQMVQDTFNVKRPHKKEFFRFTIRDRRLILGLYSYHLNNHRFRSVWKAIAKLNELVPLPDVDFLLSTEDGFCVDPGDLSCPVFAFSKVEGLSPFILIPDSKALQSYAGLREEIIKSNRKYSWTKKLPQVFWRGGVNGPPIRMDNWSVLPRIKLVLQSLLFPQEINARFVNLHSLSYAPPEISKIFKERKMAGRWVGKKDHLKYKYLVDIDGGSCTFERYYWLLLSNSVVLKQITPNQQWYYGMLEPYKHYIPVKEDLSDLMEQIRWAKENDDEARKIAENATDLVMQHLSGEDIYVYLYHLICEYARLQKNELL